MTDINRVTLSVSRLGVRALERLFKASVHIHGAGKIPDGVTIFVANHFTRLETLILVYELSMLTKKTVMSLAHHTFYNGALGSYLENVGAISTKDPNRNRIIIRSLLTGENPWLFFPEGAMIKDKKIIARGKFSVYSYTGVRRAPHTGAAVLALCAELFRRRLFYLQKNNPDTLRRQLKVLDLKSMDEVTHSEIFIVPVNVTYYPIRPAENAITRFASYIAKDIPARVREELLTEGAMLLSGVNIDICIGNPLAVKHLLDERRFRHEIVTPKPIAPNGALPSRSLLCRIAGKLMMDAMATVYRMTCVNYDHLIAYILRYYPGRHLTMFDLAERLYLAVDAVSKDACIRFHPLFNQNKVVQICHSYRETLTEFLSVAGKSGTITLEGETIYKKKSNKSVPFNFHTIRIENMFQVILNEVEYLRSLTWKLRLIAWYPRWFIHRRLRKRLLKSAQAEFITDYATYYIKKDTKPPSIGAPVFLHHRRARAGVLMVHGYLAAPEEVRPLAENLHHHGYTVYAPRLPGHGTSPEDLAQRRWEEWLESVEQGYLMLSNCCEKVVLGGFSAGATLALLAASNNLYDNVKAVCAINPAMRLRKRTARIAPAVMLWHNLADKLVNEESRQYFVPNRPENPDINYLRNPISGVRELIELIDVVWERLDAITVPALIIQASDDPVVHPEGSKQLHQKLGSRDKELFIFPHDRHGIIRGDGSDLVFARVVKFLDSRV
ncbi:MAG: alpha/beta fold hydrolase [bacterium]